MSDKVNNKKVAGLIRPSADNSKGSRKSGKRGIFGKLGAYFSSHWVYSAVISPIVLIICIGLLFSIRGKGDKE